MDCTLTQERLVGFHFGQEDAPTFEAHLSHCPSCLQSYWELKRATELSVKNEERPRRATYQRLHLEFAAAFPSLVALARERWVEVSLLAAAAALLAILLHGRTAGLRNPATTAGLEAAGESSAVSIIL